jgi:exopolyphosphatase / guanosine-5'-triphosphate,3'-diphosphate pyrophosphatase
MRRAVIDIGTNTVKLLVAEVHDGQVTPLAVKDTTTRLGERVHETQRLSPAAISRTVKAIAHFVAEAHALEAADITAITTSAARDATNRDDFFDAVRRQCGLVVQMISGEREAELIFRGVCSDPVWAGQPVLVMDVGGGSTEVIQGVAGKIERHRSLQIGAVRMTEQFGEAQFTELCAFLRDTLRRELADYSLSGRRLIGTGGTILTLANIALCGRGICRTQRRRLVELGFAPIPEILGPAGRGRACPEFAEGNAAPTTSPDHAILTCDEARSLVERLRAMSLSERRNVPGLSPERADIIVAGGAVVIAAMETLGSVGLTPPQAGLTVSVRNLWFGALLKES